MEDMNPKDLLLCLEINTKLNTYLRNTIQYYTQRITTENDNFKHIKARRSRSTDKNTRYENKQHNPQASNNSTLKATPASVWQRIDHQTYDYYGFTQLHLACILEKTDIVAAIIRLTKNSEFLDIQNAEGQTALHLAAITEQVNILRMLLLAGANPNLRDHHGNTALHLACMTSNDESVSALIEPFDKEEINNKFAQFKSAAPHIIPTDLEICNRNGQRCIHLVTEAGYLNILDILLNAGADINARERKAGRTSLHIAIEKHNDDIISFILKEHLSSVNLVTATYAGLTIYQAALSIKKHNSMIYAKRKHCSIDVNTK